jgi:hypothetical protein
METIRCPPCHCPLLCQCQLCRSPLSSLPRTMWSPWYLSGCGCQEVEGGPHHCKPTVVSGGWRSVIFFFEVQFPGSFLEGCLPANPPCFICVWIKKKWRLQILKGLTFPEQKRCCSVHGVEELIRRSFVISTPSGQHTHWLQVLRE